MLGKLAARIWTAALHFDPTAHAHDADRFSNARTAAVARADRTKGNLDLFLRHAVGERLAIRLPIDLQTYKMPRQRFQFFSAKHLPAKLRIIKSAAPGEPVPHLILMSRVHMRSANRKYVRWWNDV